ncbi:transient receptor potential cation channel subfamily M member-like 2 [Mytilus californianus]|uniref:transient receptor potential cation channel subfamily M member-like 2 n=1 Tax=Mytilus californianus TaxID=6549 RepID=UPI0022484161|nr:transient receptor potential cation channel subfamily M member-like 2 [Mytilus californianus]
MQLKVGLLELIKTTNIWILTEEKCTGVREIVEEVIDGYSENSKSRVLFKDVEFDLTKVQSANEQGNTSFQPNESDLENCIKEHLEIPLIIIVVGGEENSFETAMINLKRNVPVLVIDGSGKTANFICKGYRRCMHKHSETNIVFSNIFKSEMMEAAKMLYGSNDEEEDTKQTSREKLARQLQEGLEENFKSIHVYLATETTYTLDRTIQDILFQSLCTDNKNEEKLTDNMLYFVDLWNRPDIAEREIFNLEKNGVFEKLQDKLGEKQSCLSNLFTNALRFNRVDLVRQVLEYILDKKQYRKFLDHSLEDLYEDDASFGGYVFRKITKKKSRQKNIVEKVDVVVKKITGRLNMHIFDEGDADDIKIDVIRIEDIFKHLFIWAVFMNRVDLAILFWKKEDCDYIWSALYASSLAQMLAVKAGEEALMDEKAALLESSRSYEDLAYNVMTELYCMNKQYARKLLVTNVKRYNSTTIFGITEKFVLQKFMGHVACQTTMDQIWKGRISGDTSTPKAIFFAVAFIPILITNIVSLDKTDDRRKNKVIPLVMSGTKEQEKKTNGTSSQSAVKWPNWIWKIYYFYNSPLIKCFFSLVSYVAMLIAFAVYVLTDLHPLTEKTSTANDFVVFGLVVSTVFEETQELILNSRTSTNISVWMIFRWIFEILIYIMITVSTLSRRIIVNEDFCYVRMAYALTLGLLIINSVKFFLVTEYLGPKILMIVKMLFDVMFFIVIFAVLLFGFGVVYQATMYPNSPLNFQLIPNIIYMPYWQLYGELFLDRFEGKETNGTASCPFVYKVNTFILAVYMVVTHIIIVNMLIAMLSHTFEKEQDNNHLAWKFDRFSIIKQYYLKSSMLPPLSTIVYFVRTIMIFCNGCNLKYCTMNRQGNLNVKRTVAENKKLAIVEKDAVYSYFKSSTWLKMHHARKKEAEKTGLVASYEEDSDLRV